MKESSVTVLRLSDRQRVRAFIDDIQSNDATGADSVANLFSLSLSLSSGGQGGVREEETQAERGLCAVRRPPGVCVHVTTSCGGALRTRNR